MAPIMLLSERHSARQDFWRAVEISCAGAAVLNAGIATTIMVFGSAMALALPSWSAAAILYAAAVFGACAVARYRKAAT